MLSRVFWYYSYHKTWAHKSWQVAHMMVCWSPDKNHDTEIIVEKIETLRHITRALPNGGAVFVLNRGVCTIFIEGVSMLAANAIRDWPLHSGHETPTGDVDFGTRSFINPLGYAPQDKRKCSCAILGRWRNFYVKGLEDLVPDLKTRFPRKGEEEEEYERVVRARVFDIMRGFLPAGATINLTWHSNLRQIADKLLMLRHHPLEEVRCIAKAIEDATTEAFPDSFEPNRRHEKTERYNKCLMDGYYYKDLTCPDFDLIHDGIDHFLLEDYMEELSNRPPKTELPKHIAGCGTLRFRFLLDFGSFRDIQRNRAVSQRMPLVTTHYGFSNWYISELTPELRQEALQLLHTQEREIAELEVEPEIAQYYVAMGYNLPNQLAGDLHALACFIELRATRFVHPTLRRRARQMAEVLMERFKSFGLILHLDEKPGRFDTRRSECGIGAK